MSDSDLTPVGYVSSGGLLHMLRFLGNVTYMAANQGRIVVPLTEGNDLFRIPFHRVFESRSENLTSSTSFESDVARLRKQLPDPSLQLSQISSIGNRRRGYNFALGGCLYDKMGSAEVDSHDTELGLLTSGSVRSKHEGFSELQHGIGVVTVQDHVLRHHLAQAAVAIERPFVTVHFRNTDWTSDFDQVASDLENLMLNEEIKGVYWATDDRSSLIRIQARISGKPIWNFCQLPDVRGLGSENLHSVTDQDLQQVGSTKLQQISQALGDYFLMCSADYFIGASRSNSTNLRELSQSKPELVSGFFGQDPATQHWQNCN